MDTFTDKELDELATLQKVNKADTLSSMFLENDFLFIKENEIIFPIEIQEVIENTDLKGLSKNNKLNAIKFYLDINGVLSIDKLKELLEATDFSITTKELKEYLKELNLKVNKNKVYLNDFAFNMDKRYNLSKIKENFEDYAIYNLDDIKEIQETNEKNDYVLEIYKLLKSNIKDKNDCFNTANEILNYIKLGYNLEENIQEKMDSKNLTGTEKEVKDFNHLLQEIYDNTPAWNLNGYSPKEKEINLSEEDVSQILGYIKMYLIMNGAIKIDKLLEFLIQEHHFDITKEDLIEISKISPDNHMISQYFCLAGIDKDILNGLLEQKSKFPKYKVINNLDNFFEEHDVTETKLKKLINKYIDNQIVENQILSLIIMGGINEFTLNITLNANKIKLSENKRNRMLKDLENCQKNVRIWSLNGYTMNEVLHKKY